MPVQDCQIDGVPGRQWGPDGTCYVGPEAEAEALAQGRAIEANRNDGLSEYREDIGGGVESHIDDNGYLRITGIAAKTGVLSYLLPNGTVRRELVPADTLFNVDSLSTLIGAPVTLEHPGVLNPESSAQFAKGSVPRADADGNGLSVSVVLTSQDAIDAVRGGKRQLSPGYRAELDMTPGEYEGIRYDAVQTRRVYNHLAIVSSARGGPDCKLHLDSLTGEGIAAAVEIVPPPPTKEAKMPTIQLRSGVAVEVPDASTAAAIQGELNVLGQRADAADEMVEKAKYDELMGERDALLEKLKMLEEAAEGEEKMDSDSIGAYIETVEKAKALNPKVEIKQDGKYLGSVALMAAAMGIDPTGKSDEYVQARFDAACEHIGTDAMRTQRDATRQDAKEPVLTGRAKFMKAEQARSNGGA